jgi:hypothetical protein
MEIAEIARLAEEAGLDAEALCAVARPAVVLPPDLGVPDTGPHTRLGGQPSLPAAVPWPQREGRSLAFVGQIDLASLPGDALGDACPRDGLLLFFYDESQRPWGFAPDHAGGFAVVHVSATEATVPDRDWPDDLPAEARFEPVALTAREAVTLPPWDSVVGDSLGIEEDDDVDAYDELLEAVGEDDLTTRALVGGYPDQIQGDIMLECAVVSDGVSYGDDEWVEDPGVPAWRDRSLEWRLLFQVPTMESSGMYWGSDGCLYFCIREADLRERRFDRAWMVLQCT